MKLGLVQIKGDCQRPERFRRLLSLVRKAAGSGARILVLPELFLHRYFCQAEDSGNFLLAHSQHRDEIKRLRALAKELEIVLIVPYFEKREKDVYHNSAVIFDADGSDLGTYRKMHIPDDPGFHEKYYFTPGDLGFKTFSTRYGRVGVLICWDQWFPEAARLTALSGCDLIVCPTAIAWDRRELKGLSAEEGNMVKTEQLEAWKTVQRSHAIANGVFLAAVNRVGREDNLDFWGSSFICNTMGGELGSLNVTEEKVLIADCDFGEIEKTRNTWTFFRDRRPEWYGGLVERFN
ncbi:carbon-nitrogen hydrolase [Fibrobacterota bacterium]